MQPRLTGKDLQALGAFGAPCSCWCSSLWPWLTAKGGADETLMESLLPSLRSLATLAEADSSHPLRQDNG